jgi:hypothetical protein
VPKSAQIGQIHTYDISSIKIINAAFDRPPNFTHFNLQITWRGGCVADELQLELLCSGRSTNAVGQGNVAASHGAASA